jgi:leader peptidase (prepilin peptidase) / N-methyltransferase
MPEVIFPVFATLLGAIVGSFLNACIHRMPRNIPLSNPRRSFCPSCQRLIPWYENIPLLSWLALRGRCSGCKARISARYFLVEALTAGLFLWVWMRYGLPLAPAYAVIIALLIAATFIDIEHFIIPDEITWGGTAAGLLLSFLLPQLMGVTSHWQALGLSLAGAALGYGLLWLIVELGKLAFGRKRHKFSPPEPFSIAQREETIVFSIDDESLSWEEIFSRESDELVLECPELDLAGTTHQDARLRIRHDRVIFNDTETPLEDIPSLKGTLRSAVIPREAMGFGDVKFIAAIGAFLGWKAVLFTLCSASFIGCFAALAGFFIARDQAGTRVPFGPFLALGAAIWIFGGEAIWEWYFRFFAVGSMNF